MSATIQLSGNLLVQLAEGAQPQPVPLNFSLTYVEKVIFGFNYTTSQTNTPIPVGSVTNPRFILVFLYLGAISLSWDSGGLAPTLISANPTPPPTDQPLMMLFRYNAPSSALFLTTTAPARGEIWLFE